MKKKDSVKSNLTYERKNFWKAADAAERKAAMDFAVDYRDFLDRCKTVRETIAYSVEKLSKAKFVALPAKGKQKRVYSIFRGKTIAMAIIGSEPISAGVNMVAAHIDTPRVDLKQNPLYEDGNSAMACMRTHYYGGIKKYQWVSTPLALHGTIVKSDGSLLMSLWARRKTSRSLSFRISCRILPEKSSIPRILPRRSTLPK
jgi:aspartyl aminopeptidase